MATRRTSTIPAYDFNDEVIPHGVSYWVRLAETALAA